MPAILQFGVTMQCPHGGTVIAVPSNMRVRVGGVFALLQSDVFTIVGCPLMVGPKPQPCLTVTWQMPAMMLTIGGQPVLTEASIGMCQSAEQIVQGLVIISGAQQSAKAT